MDWDLKLVRYELISVGLVLFSVFSAPSDDDVNVHIDTILATSHASQMPSSLHLVVLGAT